MGVSSSCRGTVSSRKESEIKTILDWVDGEEGSEALQLKKGQGSLTEEDRKKEIKEGAPK